MKNLLPLLCLMALPATAQHRAPLGGGHYTAPQGVCITPAQQAAIQQRLDVATQELIKKGLLPSAAQQQKATATMFDWPLKQAAGFNYFNIYGISNYVDNDLTYPNKLQDWNCGTRTYDLTSGYNHGGMDIFLWPFDMNMMASGQAEIVAAADGMIISKEDGNFDQNCAMGSGQWNAVYLKHADGTVTWYGHMKKGSVTSKTAGSMVKKGEYLGTVGSSGSSTGPHLHFEVHDATGNVIDPYHGNCNGTASMWNSQRPYYQMAVNAVMTHSDEPILNPCPQLHNINARDTFRPGDNVYMAVYVSDYNTSGKMLMKVYDPTGAVYAAWDNTEPDIYTAAYWYWQEALPVTAKLGKWKFEVTLAGKSYAHDFYVQFPTNIADAEQKPVKLYPNPAGDYIKIENAIDAGVIRISNMLGQQMYNGPLPASQTVDTRGYAAGVYILHMQGQAYTFRVEKP